MVEARDVAEAGARAALEALAVHHYQPYTHMSPARRVLRNHLRARARQLGDRKLPKPDSRKQDHEINHLILECAYEHWHRMLFARFLAENSLLIEPEMGVAMSLTEAEELAKEEGVDVWVFASRCAQRMLPEIFRPDDPLLQVSFATEHMLELEKLLASLPAAVFTASDALGWVYQYWQSKKKDEVNRSEVKIGADEISAVTQLFTEPYMVEFLLHNTLGAWWAGRKLSPKDAAAAKTEDELRAKLALPGVGWEYLRFVRGADGASGPWRPAAGTFDGWPKTAADLRVLDPCCGSGHFLVAGLHHLVPIRQALEGLSAADAVAAVLRDNLHGLEIDERCCQIAAFALAFAAWTYPDAGGYRPLPELHIAWAGMAPQCTAEEWLALAEQSGMPESVNERDLVERSLVLLHELFLQAPTLGSLIDPRRYSAGRIAADYGTVEPYFTAALRGEIRDYDVHERTVAAAGMVKAAELLAARYALVVTNVPYLTRKTHGRVLSDYGDGHHPDGKLDLANMVLDRCLDGLPQGGTMATVSPQAWLSLKRYSGFRESWLRKTTWHVVSRLGEGAFDSTAADGAFVILLINSRCEPARTHAVSCLDLSESRTPTEKGARLRSEQFLPLSQHEQVKNPDAIIVFDQMVRGSLLSEYGNAWQGISTSDFPRFGRCFWELEQVGDGWVFQQSTVLSTEPWEGRSTALLWEDGHGAMTEVCQENAPFRGQSAWGKTGVAVSQMRSLPATLYTGEKFDGNCSVITAFNDEHIAAIWSFVQSANFAAAVRRIDTSVKVTNNSLVKVPFDLAHWQKVAAKMYPDGLPEPESNDPRQWLFHGRPEESTGPLQVAVARLLGYRWPGELDDKSEGPQGGMRLSKRARALVAKCGELAKFADGDGIVCIPSVRGEEPAAERLEALLAAAGVKPANVRELAGGTLEDWLRNSFFEEHCKLFQHRPFVWHIWDGRKRDGFHALVNYHKLCEGGGKGRRLLESLTYAYLGEWITRQKDGVKRGEGGAEDRLAAALELQNRLKTIIDGEPPFDIFVRWKPLAEQPIGWEPDLSDGVRMNIRPFLASDLPNGRKGAGILRHKPNIKWTKDRGKEPDRPKEEYPWFWGFDPDNPDDATDFMGRGEKPDGKRWNDCHYTTKFKQAACHAAEKGA